MHYWSLGRWVEIFHFFALFLRVCIVPPFYSRLRDLLPAAVRVSVLSANLQHEPVPQARFTHCSESSRHRGRPGSALPCSAGTLRRGCATTNTVTTKVQNRNVLALQRHCHYLWKTLLPPQMLVGSSCMTSLKKVLEQEVGMKKGRQQGVPSSSESQRPTPVRAPHASLLSFFWLAAVGIPTLSASAAMNPASSTKFISCLQADASQSVRSLLGSSVLKAGDIFEDLQTWLFHYSASFTKCLSLSGALLYKARIDGICLTWERIVRITTGRIAQLSETKYQLHRALGCNKRAEERKGHSNKAKWIIYNQLQNVFKDEPTEEPFRSVKSMEPSALDVSVDKV